jgi:hypothetical protein
MAMRVLVFFFLLVLATATPSPAECTLCKLIVGEAAKFGGNGTDVNKTIAVLQHDCAKVFPKNGTLAEACDGISKDLVDVLPFLDEQIGTLAWDPEAVCAAAGRCTEKCCLSATKPEQIHLALTRDSSEMRVTWVTEGISEQHVQWGPSASGLTFSSDSINSTYSRAGWIGIVHTAVMHGLSSGVKVFYRVGNPSGDLSKVYSFTPIPSGVGMSDQAPLKFAVVGDMGYGPNSDATIATLSKWAIAGEFHGVIHSGDISYADGEQTHWDIFQRKIESIAARVPYLTAPGNHEFWYNFTAYKVRFGDSMPRSDEVAAIDGMYYSVDVNNLHIVSLNTESELDNAHMSKAQTEWLDADLQANLEKRQLRSHTASPTRRLRLRSHRMSSASNTTAWVAAFGHRPFYCSNPGPKDIREGQKTLRAAAENILLQGHADVVIQAHVHDYERSFPVAHDNATARNYEKPAAPVYIVNGAAGNRENNAKPPGTKSWDPPADPAKGIVPYAQEISFGIMSVEGAAMRWTQYCANGTKLDEFVITK